MHASFEALKEDEYLLPNTADRYLDLAVFDRDAYIPEAAMLVLWEPTGLKELDVQDLCDTLVDRSLLRRNEDGRYRLHNLQSDYLQSQHSDLPGIHRCLVQSYEQRCGGRWAEGVDDGYYYENLPRHLRAAEESATLQEVLADAAWIRAKLVATDPWALADDARLIPAGQRGFELLYAALRMAAPVLAASRDQLVPQLLGRLGGLDEPVVVRLLEDLRNQAQSPWVEPLWATLRRPDGPLIWSLEGHEAGAYSVAVTPDGRRAVIGTAHGSVVLWDLRSGRRSHHFRGPEGWAFSVAVTSSCSHVAAAYGEHGVVVWDVASGKSVVALEGKACAAVAVAFTPDREHIVTGQDDGSVRLWRVDGGQAAGVLEGRHQELVQSLVVTPDGKRAVTGAADGTLGFWNLLERRVDIVTPAHSARVWTVALNREARRVASFSDSGTVVLSDIESGEEIDRFNTGSWGCGCCFLGDGERVVTADTDGELKVWSLAGGALVRKIRAHKSFAERVATVSGSVVISTSRDSTARVWDIDREGGVEAEVGHTAPVLGVAVSTTLSGVCSASQDRTLKLWDMKSGGLLSTVDNFEGPVRAVAFLPGTSRIITGDGQGQLTILDLRGLEVVARMAVHVPAIQKTQEGSGFGFGGVVSLRLVREGELAWSCGSAGDVASLDLAKGELTRNVVQLEPPVVGDISADGATAVLGSGRGSLAVVSLADWSSVTMNVESLSSFMSVVIDPRGTFAVSSHADGAVACWALRDHARLLIKPDPSGGATVMSWETGKREPISASSHVVLARGLAVTQGSELLVAAFSDGWVRLWRLDNLEPYAAFHCDEELYSCAVDGPVIALGGRDRVHLLQIHTSSDKAPDTAA